MTTATFCSQMSEDREAYYEKVLDQLKNEPEMIAIYGPEYIPDLLLELTGILANVDFKSQREESMHAIYEMKRAERRVYEKIATKMLEDWDGDERDE